MSRNRSPVIESFKNSLRWSLRFQCDGLSEHKVRCGEFFISAPLSELAPFTDLAMPKYLPLLADFEFDGEIKRIWFELDFVRINRMELTAIYHATCDC